MNRSAKSIGRTCLLLLPCMASAQPGASDRMQTVPRALDTDSDRTLSTDEIQQASERLAGLDTSGDGKLSLEEIGGSTEIPGTIRQQLVVRVLDKDDDLTISAEERANASHSLARLDHDGDWQLSGEELYPLNAGGAAEKTQPTCGA